MKLRTTLASMALAAAAVAAISLQAQGAWKEYKDFSGFTVPVGGGRAGATPPKAPASTNPAERSWKLEPGGVISSVPIAESKQPSGGLNTVDKYTDFELMFDYKLDEAPTNDCTPKLGPKPGRGGAIEPQANLSTGAGCAFNSGVSFRSGYQLNLGRREAGEYVGIVTHRDVPFAIRAEHVTWLSTGDCGAKNNVYLQDCSQFPEIRKKGDWNSIRIVAKGPKIDVWMNDKHIVDITDDPVAPAEASWKQPQPISIQFPPAGEGGGFPGKVQYRNFKVRSL